MIDLYLIGKCAYIDIFTITHKRLIIGRDENGYHPALVLNDDELHIQSKLSTEAFGLNIITYLLIVGNVDNSCFCIHFNTFLP